MSALLGWGLGGSGQGTWGGSPLPRLDCAASTTEPAAMLIKALGQGNLPCLGCAGPAPEVANAAKFQGLAAKIN